VIFLNIFINGYLKQDADCGTGIMETGDHFNNGARPKSQTSRENVNKT
jgi:hypothetical protein